MGKRGIAGKDEAAGHERRFAEQDHGASVPGVGERAADKGEGEDRPKFEHAQRPDQEHAVRELVNLVWKRDRGDHRAEERDKTADEEQAEVSVPAQRRDVDRREVPPPPRRALG